MVKELDHDLESFLEVFGFRIRIGALFRVFHAILHMDYGSQ